MRLIVNVFNSTPCGETFYCISRAWFTLAHKWHYYTLNSLTSFLSGRKRTVAWIFEISACDIITADYTSIMSSTFKVMGNHVKFTRFVSLPISEEEKNMTYFCSICIIKQILLDSVFVISRIIKVSVRVISLGLWLQLITLKPWAWLFWISQKQLPIIVCNEIIAHIGNVNNKDNHKEMIFFLILFCSCYICCYNVVNVRMVTL